MIKRTIGIIATLAILTLIVFTILGREHYSSLLFGRGKAAVEVSESSDPKMPIRTEGASGRSTDETDGEQNAQDDHTAGAASVSASSVAQSDPASQPEVSGGDSLGTAQDIVPATPAE